MARKNTLICLLLFIASTLIKLAPCQSIAQTANGPVQGMTKSYNSTTLHVFRGIPYAQAPINNLRFSKPLEFNKTWTNPFNATVFGPSCPQTIFFQMFNRLSATNPGAKQSEDCLFMNIYTPQIDNKANLPVFIWIHEGGLTFGAGAFWQGDVFAATQNAVVVTFNYRLGALGFVSAEDPVTKKPIIEPNLGFLDQHLAIKWVNKNIANFGGDKTKVTIGGNSAGGLSTGFQMLAPSNKGLFQKVIMESGNALLPDGYYGTLAEASSIYIRLTYKTGCNRTSMADSFACLKALPYSELIKGQNIIMTETVGPIKPIANTAFVPGDPKKMIQNGQVLNVSVLLGSCKEDGTLYLMLMPGFGFKVSRQFFHIAVAFLFNSYTSNAKNTITFEYTHWANKTSPTWNYQLAVHMYTDVLFLTPSVVSARYFSRHGLPTYLFEFSQRTQNSGYFPVAAGVTHSMEIPYVFGYPFDKPKYDKDNYTNDDRMVSKDMMDRYGNFLRSGNPNSLQSTEPMWPMFNETAPRSYVFLPIPKIKSDLRPNKVEFWNNLIPTLNKKIVATLPPSTMKPTMPQATSNPMAQQLQTYQTIMWAMVGVGAFFLLTTLISVAYIANLIKKLQNSNDTNNQHKNGMMTVKM